jgi:hypothetical protein
MRLRAQRRQPIRLTYQKSAIRWHYFSLKTNQHQPPTRQVGAWNEIGFYLIHVQPAEMFELCLSLSLVSKASLNGGGHHTVIKTETLRTVPVEGQD